MEGWTGDGQLTAAEASLNFDTRAMYSAWADTMRDSDRVGCALHSATPVPNPNPTPNPNPNQVAHYSEAVAQPLVLLLGSVHSALVRLGLGLGFGFGFGLG